MATISRPRFAQLWNSGTTLADMSRQLGVSETTIKRWRIRFGLPERGLEAAPVPDDFAEVAPTMLLKELVDHYEASSAVVYRWMRVTGVKPKKPDAPPPLTPIQRRHLDRAYEAGHHLRKFYCPVFHLGRERGDLFGNWQVGARVMAEDEMLALAEQKGFVHD